MFLHDNPAHWAVHVHSPNQPPVICIRACRPTGQPADNAQLKGVSIPHLNPLELQKLHHVGVARHAEQRADDVGAAVAVVKQLLQQGQQAAGSVCGAQACIESESVGDVLGAARLG